jgi:hypothetical protein
LQLLFNNLNEKSFVVGMVIDAKEHIPERPYSWIFEDVVKRGQPHLASNQVQNC